MGDGALFRTSEPPELRGFEEQPERGWRKKEGSRINQGFSLRLGV